MTENNESEPQFHTPIDLLKYTSSEFQRLEGEADHALKIEKDVAKVQSKLTERARLLIDLPVRMSRLVEENRTHFDEERMIQLEQFAHMAEERIKDGDYFSLSTLLINKGYKQGEPNALEELIEGLS